MHRAVVFAHYDKYNSIQEYVLYNLCVRFKSS